MTTPSFDGQWEAAVRIAGRSGHGARLPRGARRLLETLTGADLSSVRVHTTRDVATLGARAVACGEDVHFAPGRGAPDTEEGMALLGHEVAHVLQQRRAAARAALAAVTLRIDPLDEFEADVLGALAARALASGAARVERSGVARRLVGDGAMRTRRMPRARGRVLQPSILPSGVFGGLDPNKRQNAPNGWARTVVKPDIDWKYHHVISWDALRDTWQGLLEHQAWDALEAYMHAVNVTGAAAIRGSVAGEDALPELQHGVRHAERRDRHELPVPVVRQVRVHGVQDGGLSGARARRSVMSGRRGPRSGPVGPAPSGGTARPRG